MWGQKSSKLGSVNLNHRENNQQILNNIEKFPLTLFCSFQVYQLSPQKVCRCQKHQEIFDRNICKFDKKKTLYTSIKLFANPGKKQKYVSTRIEKPHELGKDERTRILMILKDFEGGQKDSKRPFT